MRDLLLVPFVEKDPGVRGGTTEATVTSNCTPPTSAISLSRTLSRSMEATGIMWRAPGETAMGAEEAFALFDSDSSGFLDKDELRAVLRSTGLEQTEDRLTEESAPTEHRHAGGPRRRADETRRQTSVIRKPQPHK